MPTIAVGISESVITAAESMPCTNSTEVGFASTPDCDPSASNGVSVRIEELMQMRSRYASAAEFEIEAFKVHWSELDTVSTSDEEDEGKETGVEVFERLRKKWGNFFQYYGDRLVVGEKIAEGAQAEIFNAVVTRHDSDVRSVDVLKVFKEGYSLRDLEKQWPLGMLQNRPHSGSYYTRHSCLIFGATLLRNGRFAFRMDKYWGDLRKLIDFRMQHNRSRFPPFTNSEVFEVVLRIADGMHELHEHNILNRDLKVSNVLIQAYRDDTFDPAKGWIICDVADFECSVGVVGTGYWRALEILHAVRDCAIKPELFTEASDVYSFAMTCYEVLTGCIPFEDLGGSCYAIVIKGLRPELPEHGDPLLKTLLTRCWHANPSERPSFTEIRECLKEIYPSDDSS